MSWPDLGHLLKDLLKAARGREQLNVITFTFVTVDKLPGIGKWRIKWRYVPGDQWVGFRPYEGTHAAVLAAAMRMNKGLTNRAANAKPPPTEEKIRHSAGSWKYCAACWNGQIGHVEDNPEKRW